MLPKPKGRPKPKYARQIISAGWTSDSLDVLCTRTREALEKMQRHRATISLASPLRASGIAHGPHAAWKMLQIDSQRRAYAHSTRSLERVQPVHNAPRGQHVAAIAMCPRKLISVPVYPLGVAVLSA